MNLKLTLSKALYITLFFCSNAFADHILINKIEEEISKQSGFEDVLISNNLNLDCKNCRFSNLKIDKEKKVYTLDLKNDDSEINITGNYYEAIKLPVVVSKISKSDLISDEKIEYRKLRNNRKYEDYFTDKLEIVGNVAMKNLTIGFPINKRDIAKGELVKRNTEVKIVYNKGSISLESIGKAISEGGIGSEIKVKNLESGKIIIGKIIDSKTVRVGE